MNDNHGLTRYRLTLWSRDLCLWFGLRYNSFIGDRRNHVRVVVIMMAFLVAWITQGLNPAGSQEPARYILRL
jgi:hypothetical protein